MAPRQTRECLLTANHPLHPMARLTAMARRAAPARMGRQKSLQPARVCARACVRAWVRACMHARCVCVCACVCACLRVCVRVSVCVCVDAGAFLHATLPPHACASRQARTRTRAGFPQTPPRLWRARTAPSPCGGHVNFKLHLSGVASVPVAATAGHRRRGEVRSGGGAGDGSGGV